MIDPAREPLALLIALHDEAGKRNGVPLTPQEASTVRLRRAAAILAGRMALATPWPPAGYRVVLELGEEMVT